MDSIQSFYNSDSKKLTQLNPPSRYHTCLKISCCSISSIITPKHPFGLRFFYSYHCSCSFLHSKSSRQPGDISFFSRTDPIGECMFSCLHLLLKFSQFTASTWKAFYNTCFRLYLYLCLFGRVQVPGGLHDVCLGLQQQREQGVEGIARQLDRAHRLRSHRQPLQAFARGPGCLHGRISQEDHANIQIFLISKSTKSILQVTSLASLPGQYGNGTYSGQHQHRDKYPAKKRVHAYGESNSLLEVP